MRTSEQIYSYNQRDSENTTLIVRTNGGQVEVWVSEKDANDWVLSDVFTADGAHHLFTGRIDVRVVPTGGAEFYLDREHDL